MATIRRRRDNVRTLRKKDGLIRYAKDITSQNGEDGILRHLFDLVVIKKEEDERLTSTKTVTGEDNHDSMTNHYTLVDVGAWDGQHLSNTYSLLVGSSNNNNNNADECGDKWNGVLIEANKERYRELQNLHEPLGNVCVNRSVSGVKGSDRSLERILDEFGPKVGLPANFDFLCIDIDGADFWVWSNLLESITDKQEPWRPKVVCIEFNPSMPNDLIYIPPQDDSIRHGASLGALVELASKHNYVLVETTIFNAFFVQLHLYDQYLTEVVPDTSIEVLHEPSMGSSLYQLYDGTLKLTGCKKLLWHRIPIDEESIQILPKNQRQFPFAEHEKHDDTFDAPLAAVDMSSYCRHDHALISSSTSPKTIDQEQHECTTKLLEHLSRDGFCYVRGTGVDPKLCRDALHATNSFLQVVDETVRQRCLSKTDHEWRGYSPMNTETSASLLSKEGLKDLARKFRIGPPSDAGNTTSHNSSPLLLQPNIWPDRESWDFAPHFRSAIEGYYNAACSAANAVIDAICVGLHQENPELANLLAPLMTKTTEVKPTSKDDTQDLTDKTTATTSILTLLGYRVGSRHRGKKKGPLVVPHTDVGLITLLISDGAKCAATLQRRTKDGRWIDVTLPKQVPEDPIFVVSVGDCLSDLTDGRLPPTLNCVVASNGTNATPRNCCALSVDLDPT